MKKIAEDENSPDLSSLHMSVVDMVWPDQCNHHDTLFGGAALSMLDRLAFTSSSLVYVSIDS